MSRFSLRRIAAVGVSAALLGTGLTVGLGSGVAGAYSADTCSTSAEKEFSNAGTFGTKYYVTKTVDGDGTVASDGTVSFIISVRGAGGMIGEIRDFHPEGFQMTKVESNVNHLLGGQKWTKENGATQGGGKVTLGGLGWTTAGNATATIRVTYKATSGIKLGEKVNAGGAGFKINAIVNGNPDFKDMDLCLTGRIPNPVEIIGSGLGSLGLGSIADLGGSLTGSIGDPSSPLNSGSMGSS